MASIAPRCRLSINLAKKAVLSTRALSRKAISVENRKLGCVIAQRVAFNNPQIRLQSTTGQANAEKMTLSLLGITDTLPHDKEKYSDALTTAAGAFQDAEKIFNDPNFSSKKDWVRDEPVGEGKEGQDLKVFSKTTKEGINLVAIESILLGNVDCVLLDTWTQTDDMKQWNSSIEHSCFVAQLTDHVDIIHTCNNDILIANGRDYVNVRIYRKIGDGYIIAARSVDLPEEKPYKGKVRAWVHLAAARLRPHPQDKNKTISEVLTHVDLKGNIPKMIVNQAISRFAVYQAQQNKKHFEMLKQQGKLDKKAQ
ncbi:unnamed protein product, partial [Mesorhabditis belari]|uniref:START domain-containing protein n=1 Tax=Mesorhabditis belari TaxID=2138241 RepID=A0AAF3F371_9BILA